MAQLWACVSRLLIDTVRIKNYVGCTSSWSRYQMSSPLCLSHTLFHHADRMEQVWAPVCNYATWWSDSACVTSYSRLHTCRFCNMQIHKKLQNFSRIVFGDRYKQPLWLIDTDRRDKSLGCVSISICDYVKLTVHQWLLLFCRIQHSVIYWGHQRSVWFSCMFVLLDVILCCFRKRAEVCAAVCKLDLSSDTLQAVACLSSNISEWQMLATVIGSVCQSSCPSLSIHFLCHNLAVPFSNSPPRLCQSAYLEKKITCILFCACIIYMPHQGLARACMQHIHSPLLAWMLWIGDSLCTC